jgi:hypothetical protein
VALNTHIGETFDSQEIVLDGQEFRGCTFKDCKLVYSGAPARVTGCTFNSLDFHLKGPAAETAKFLRGLNRDFGAVGEKMVKDLLGSP